MSSQPALRPIPYPYRAMLAICSDLDETPNWQVYWELMRFLNTTETTTMGPGLGLEVGNSIYFDMPPDQFAYWNTDDCGREMVRTLIRSGHIDCLHSYGDLATTRTHAARALEELDRHNCKLQVWTDHGTAASNFDPHIMQGRGDEIGHPAYHADLTTDYGVKYIWRGRVTSITGQGVRLKPRGIFRLRHPVQSTKTMAKEVAKHILAAKRNSKYAMHWRNQLTGPVTLRDGTNVQEFIRYNPHYAGPGKDFKPEHLAEALSSVSIAHLVQSNAVGILYTHLGKMGGQNVALDPMVVERLRATSELCRARQLLVCTTRRLIQYVNARDRLRLHLEHGPNECRIIIDGIEDPVLGFRRSTIEEMEGLTFEVPSVTAVRLILEAQEIETTQVSEDKHTYLMVPWSRLPWPHWSCKSRSIRPLRLYSWGPS